MQLTTAYFALLSVLATTSSAQTSPAATSTVSQPATGTNVPALNYPFAYYSCSPNTVGTCPKMADGVGRCMQSGTVAICMTDCPSGSTCAADCKQIGSNGFCGSGGYPCVCTDLPLSDLN
ncbi:hypothetical protein LX36DRAFT_661488 [Colletotrichum falcatum]|nr:hypothetical protein LX36DRAFT_661488 [Colletotrichum falcatum]